MKFSKRLQELRERRRAAFYVSYKELKKALKLITGADVSAVSISDAVSSFAHTKALEGEHYRPPESRFEDLLQHELEKVNSFSVSALLAASAALQQLLLQLYALQHTQQELLLNPPSPQQQRQEQQQQQEDQQQQQHRDGDAGSKRPSGVPSSGTSSPQHSAPSAAAAASTAAPGGREECVPQEAAAAAATAFERELLAVEAALDAQGQEVVFLSSYTRLNFTAFRKIAKKFDKLNNSSSAAYHMCRVMRQPFMRLNLPLLLQQLAAAYAQLRALKAMRKFPEAAAAAAKAAAAAGNAEADSSFLTKAAPGAAAAAAASAAAAAAALSAPDAAAEGLPPGTTKYLILPDEVVRLQVTLARHLQLTSIKGCCVDTATPLPAAAATAVAAAAAAKEDNLKAPEASTGLTNSSSSSSSNRVAEALASGDSRRLTSLVYFDTPNLDIFVALQTKGRNDSKNADSSSTNSSTSSSTSSKELLRIRELNGGELAPAFQGQSLFLEFANPQEPATDPQQQIFAAYDSPEVLEALPRSVLLQHQQLQQLLAGEAAAAAQQLEQQLIEAGVSRANAAARAALLREAGEAIAQQNLRPCLRVWLTRTCFKSEDGSIFVTLDEDIRFSKKGSDADVNGFVFNGAVALASEGAAPFPWGVMDVSCRRPAGIVRSQQPEVSEAQEALAPPLSCIREVIGMASVTEVFGFSLFLHGVASCFQQELQRRAQEDSSSSNSTSSNALLPHWLPYTTIAEEDDEEFQAATNIAAGAPPSPPPGGQKLALRSVPLQQHAEELQQETPPAATGRQTARSSKLDVIYRGPGSSIAHDQEASVQEMRHSLETSSTGAPLVSNGPLGAGGRGRGLREPLLGGGSSSSSSRHQQQQQPSFWLSCCGGSSRCMPLMRRCCHRLSQFLQLRVRSSRLFAAGSEGAAAAAAGGGGGTAATVRVEPKTFFANERTLLQWLNIAVLLASVAITLLSFGQTAAKVAGLLLAPVAIFFIGYSFWIYLRRSRALMRKEPIDYNDHFGPAVLVVSLMLALCANIVLNVAYNGEDTLREAAEPPHQHAQPPPAAASLLPAVQTVPAVTGQLLAATKLPGVWTMDVPSARSSSSSNSSSNISSSKRLEALRAALAAATAEDAADASVDEKAAALRVATTRAAALREIALVRAAEAAAAAAAAEKAAAAAKEAEAAAAEAEAAARRAQLAIEDNTTRLR